MIDAKKSVRFGVAFRLLSAFAAITIFAIATSVIALYTFGKYGEGFNRIASSNVPALVAASNLAQRSQALAANAPNLAVADGHFARRAVSEGLHGQLQAIADASEQVKTLAPATEGLESLIQNQALLGEKLEKLDALVAEKLEADRVAANLMLRLRTLSVRIQAMASKLLSKITEEQASRAQIDAMTAWAAAADQAIVIMLSTSSADTTIRLNQLRSEFEDARNRAETARGELSPALIEEINPLEQTLAQYGRGSPNIFDARTAQLASASAVRGGLLDTKDEAAHFVASAERIFTDIQRDVRSQSDFFGSLISEYSRLFTILSLLCIAGAAGAFLYVNRSVIQRLRKLSEGMAVSAELVDELQEALKNVSLNATTRSEITELMDTLRGNFDKVVQHGRRADSIVKNMLLHSRHSSGEHRPVDINALVEDSLNLAYHGARADKQGFNITLERSFDPAAGEVDVFPQEITRVLLNLISNGFYAATKKAQANGKLYEPILAASTKNLGDRVEIRIRDNGTGIPPEIKDKLFNPFFTTKPAGEGTGLGLSISHDIIVKQHGGSIEIDTQPGEFTELRIVLPRAAGFLAERV
jgi:signal transduction histidine kinase